jgi:hypothetical protein
MKNALPIRIYSRRVVSPLGIPSQMGGEELMSDSLAGAVQYADVKNGNTSDTTELVNRRGFECHWGHAFRE